MARVLCLHGLGGTGATMWPVVGHLQAQAEHLQAQQDELQGVHRLLKQRYKTTWHVLTISIPLALSGGWTLGHFLRWPLP